MNIHGGWFGPGAMRNALKDEASPRPAVASTPQIRGNLRFVPRFGIAALAFCLLALCYPEHSKRGICIMELFTRDIAGLPPR
jgi:hypothetical protein